MTREERVEKLRHLITCMKCEVSGKVCDDNCPTQYDAGNMGEIIENLEAISKALEQEPRWIPVSERLPEEIGTYLVTLEYKEHGTGITTLWFGSLGWDLRDADVITAWMPLPQPYKEVEE